MNYGRSRSLSEMVLSPWVLIPLAVLLGSFIAFQFFFVTPRYVKLVFGILFFLAVLRLSLPMALSLFIVIFPAPTFIFIGDTNLIFIGLMTVVWIIRTRLGLHPPRIHTPVEYALLAYCLVHILSFINISDPANFMPAVQSLSFLLAGVLLFILLVNGFRTEKHLILGMKALCATAVFVDLSAILEYYWSIRLIPTWFIHTGAIRSLATEGSRARPGGIFGFHGLLADFSAMMFYVQVLLALRTRSTAARAFYVVLAFLSLLMVSNSSNRGGAVIWGVGGLYFLWLYRHRVAWSKVVLVVVAAGFVVGSLGIISDEVLNRIGLFARLLSTHFEHGVPETRVIVWRRILEEIPNHLWIGHGPFIDIRQGLDKLFWPHSAYLFYLYTTGVLGLLTFLWILAKVLKSSRPRGRVDFKRDSWARATQAIFFIQVVMFMLAQLRDEHQRGNVYVYFMWMVFAFACIAGRLARAAPARTPAAPVPEIAPRNDAVAPAGAVKHSRASP